jgi:quercetin dioxygenase-like cupin family protein
MHVKNESFDLASGHLLALERGIVHDVEALEESAFVLTIAWPKDAKKV